MQAACPLNFSVNNNKLTQMQRELSRIAFVCATQLLPFSTYPGLLTSLILLLFKPVFIPLVIGTCRLKIFSGHMEIQRPMSMALHILADGSNLVGWRLMLDYMQTPMTQYFLESSERAAYMETRPKCAIYSHLLFGIWQQYNYLLYISFSGHHRTLTSSLDRKIILIVKRYRNV